MYGKIFDSMYDGTLAEDWRALITFQQMIVLCDADGVIDMTPGAISRRTGIPSEHIEAGIQILENPDPYSRTEGDEGRRIIRLDAHRPWGWLIVNHSKYKNLQDSDTVREQNRERKRRQRERAKQTSDSVTPESRNVTECHASSRHTDTDTDTNTKNTSRHLKMAQAIFDRIVDKFPKTKSPNLDKWATDIRLMIERDNRTPEDIWHVFCFANDDDFWSANILSTGTLRKQFDKLQAKFQQSTKPRTPAPDEPRSRAGALL